MGHCWRRDDEAGAVRAKRWLPLIQRQHIDNCVTSVRNRDSQRTHGLLSRNLGQILNLFTASVMLPGAGQPGVRVLRWKSLEGMKDAGLEPKRRVWPWIDMLLAISIAGIVFGGRTSCPSLCVVTAPILIEPWLVLDYQLLSELGSCGSQHV